ncbi:RhoGAP domain-containing protein [Metschnikowia aff. pulcherrima]|uniref:RhoGAP domain-containing protein n=1 Tax=Metschnikowia aff. pulcherrima TaxID=2163413 RepID=A0A4P6XJF9_9ASCO|nr:RhoGAP domain-containing protein [Metschnikowia aff. pulcherrima]
MTLLAAASADEPHVPMVDVTHRCADVGGLKVEIPCLLVDCFDYILENGLVEGIFRVSGSIKRMRDVTADYATYKEWLELLAPSPHDVSGVAKKFTRDYLHSIGGLFPPAVLASLRARFVSQARKSSVLSSESYRSVSTSFSSGLQSVSEETADTEYATPQSISDKLDSLVALLVSQNPARKNALFIYYLSVLTCVSARQEDTRMPNANLAIVFQQYLLETCVVEELQLYQSLLEFLLDNFDAFAAKYRSTLGLCGGVLDDPVKSTPMLLSDSLSTLPLTEYSLVQSHPKSLLLAPFDGRRRLSISQKFSTFWDAYSSPATRSKRFSFMSRGSRSSDRLPLSLENLCEEPSTVDGDRAMAPLSTDDPSHTLHVHIAQSGTRETSRESSICSLERILVSRSQSKRTYLLGFRREEKSLGVPDVAVATPQPLPTACAPVMNNFSAESLVLESSQPSFSVPYKRQSISRRFSLWLRKK